MIYYLLEYLRETFGYSAMALPGLQDLLFRCLMALLTSLVIAFLAGPKIIRWLVRMKIGDRPEFHHTALNELMRERANTPTMGGLMILLAIIGSVMLWARLEKAVEKLQKLFS